MSRFFLNRVRSSVGYFFLVLVAGFLLVRVAQLGLSGYYTGQLSENANSANVARAWQDNSRLAVWEATQPSADEATSHRRLVDALRADPTQAAALVRLAEKWSNDPERQEGADKMVALAEQLRPADGNVRWAAGGYWWTRGQWESALISWSATLDVAPYYQNSLFPVMLALAENATSRPLVSRIAGRNTQWWPAFFGYSAVNAIRTDTVEALFAARQSGANLSDDERRHFIRRLQRDGRWADAYVAWLNSLEPQIVRTMSLPFNGDFEEPATHLGFDWHYSTYKSARVAFSATHGIKGERALQVALGGDQAEHRLIFQPLFLKPGDYRLSGRVRLDSVRGNGALGWEVRCADDPAKVLGFGEKLRGIDQWRSFMFDFSVDATCPGQILRLMVVRGAGDGSIRLQGEAWFDSLQIKRLASIGD